MVRTCPRLACRRDSWRKCRRSWWKSWAARGGAALRHRRLQPPAFRGQECPRHTSRTTPTKTKTRALPGTRPSTPTRQTRARWGPAAGQAQDGGSARELQLHRQHCRVLCFAGQEVQGSETAVRGAQRQARIPSRTEGQAPEIWGRDRLSARRRWGRRQDYGTISSLRFEEIGGAVRAAGEGIELRAWSRELARAPKGQSLSKICGIAKAMP